MRAAFGTAYIRSEFERIGRQLEAPVTVYLIGGGAIVFRDLKDATNDIDLIVESGDDLGRLQSALLELDYDIGRAPSEEPTAQHGFCRYLTINGMVSCSANLRFWEELPQ